MPPLYDLPEGAPPLLSEAAFTAAGIAHHVWRCFPKELCGVVPIDASTRVGLYFTVWGDLTSERDHLRAMLEEAGVSVLATGFFLGSDRNSAMAVLIEKPDNIPLSKFMEMLKEAMRRSEEDEGKEAA